MGFLDILSSLTGQPSTKELSDMSDRELTRELRNGQGKNTGESVSTRAHKIMEAEKRGLDWKKDK